MYKDLFLDFDDTLYDTRGNATLAIAEIYQEFHLERYFDRLEDFSVPYWKINEELWAQYSMGEITREYLIVERFRRPLSLGHGLNPSPDECLHISDIFLMHCGTKSGVVEGSRELLDYLKGRYRLHICSNGFHETQYRKLRSAKMEEYFETVILSEDAGANKPSKQFFDYAFKMTGAKPETTLMIGDNFKTDILGAKRMGIDQIFFNRKHESFIVSEPVTYEVHSLLDIKNILP